MFSALRNVVLCVLTIGLLISTTYSVSYGSSSVTLEKDIVIGFPVVSIFDLPNEVTFKIYDSNTAAIPITFQTFRRGEYSAYYNIARSDGLAQKNIVRLVVKFSNFSNLNGYLDGISKAENFWTEVELDRKPAGEREPLDKEITNQILLAITAQNTGGSDTLNPQNANQDSSPQSASSTYQSAYESRKGVDGYSQKGSSNVIVQQVAGSNGQIQYNNGGVQAGASQFYYDETLKNVGIGTASPSKALTIVGEIKFNNTGTNANIISTHDNGGSISLRDASVGRMILENGFGFGFNIGGANKVRIDSNGNIGIGTTGPEYKLDVVGGRVQIHTGTNQYSLGLGRSEFPTNAYHLGVSNSSSPDLIFSNNDGTEKVRIQSNGNVGIGTTSPCSDCKLAVNGKIRAKQVVVDTGWADFVFKDDYTLMPLQELERFIRENRHLPDIPTEADVKDNGISVGDISAKLLQKIEELTLYVIELKKENEAVRSELSVLQKQLPYSWSCLGVTCHSMP